MPPAPADPASAYDELADAVSREGFVSATCTGSVRDATPPAVRLTIRPVDLTAGRHLQFSAFDGRRTDVTNLSPTDGVERFRELTRSGFATVVVRTLNADLQLVHSRKGVPRLLRHRPSASVVDTSHDRAKPRLLEETAPFLHAVGITDAQGRVKPTARAKYRQVERFVEILSHTLPDSGDARPTTGSRLRAVDLGCGAGVLTLATYHYLHHTRGLDVVMTGVDTKSDLMAKLTSTVHELGWSGLELVTGTIDAAVVGDADDPPELVLALHACDTATDDALARAVGWRSTWILAAPCCQHDLQSQMDGGTSPDDLAPLLRHGIVRERLGDLLTDSLRAEILRAHGYRTDVIEFVSTEHTAKNLMIRAVRTGRPDLAAADAAERMAGAWGVTPALARRIGYRPD